jgi:hypothetical protein
VALNQPLRAAVLGRLALLRWPLIRANVGPPTTCDVDNDDCRARRGKMLGGAGARFPSQATLNSQFVTCLGVDRS